MKSIFVADIDGETVPHFTLHHTVGVPPFRALASPVSVFMTSYLFIISFVCPQDFGIAAYCRYRWVYYAFALTFPFAL